MVQSSKLDCLSGFFRSVLYARTLSLVLRPSDRRSGVRALDEEHAVYFKPLLMIRLRLGGRLKESIPTQFLPGSCDHGRAVAWHHSWKWQNYIVIDICYFKVQAYELPHSYYAASRRRSVLLLQPFSCRLSRFVADYYCPRPIIPLEDDVVRGYCTYIIEMAWRAL